MTSKVVKRGHPAGILLVEDNPSDVSLTRREGMHAEAPRPDLVLLDLNLPRKDGRRVLTEIKEDDMLRRIPIVVLTTSNAPSDVVKCYDLHANCYSGYVTLPQVDR